MLSSNESHARMSSLIVVNSISCSFIGWNTYRKFCPWIGFGAGGTAEVGVSFGEESLQSDVASQLAWQVSTLQLSHFSNISCSVCTLITLLCVTKTVQRFRDVCNTGGEERRMVDINCRFKTFSFRCNPSQSSIIWSPYGTNSTARFTLWAICNACMRGWDGNRRK